jgi:phosphatidylinositol-3-phosphatase
MRLLAPAFVACLLLAGCQSSDHGPHRLPSSSTAVRSSSRPTGPAAGGAPASTPAATTPTARPPAVPRFAHIVVVVEENRADSQVLGSPDAPYLNALGRDGAVLTDSYGIRHPSQPNYLALFSGSTRGLTDDSCPHSYSGDNLGSQLLASGLTFAGYSESLPSVGYQGCSAGPYARKHAPWVDFADLPASVNRPLSSLPADWSALPTVAFVIPNLSHDMHDGTVREGDTWLRNRLGGYVTWARTHNSLLIVTWDEDDFTPRNRIPGVLAGAHVRRGPYSARVDHYTTLRTIEAAYALPPLGTAARRSPITSVWTP